MKTTSSLDALQPLLADARLWRAASLGQHRRPVLPSGHAQLDAELPGGGWPLGELVEVLQTSAGFGVWQLLGPALRQALQPRQPGRPAPTLLLVHPPHDPHLPGLALAGLPSERLIWVAPHPQASPLQACSQALWITEQVLRSGADVLTLAWLPSARPEQIRRLQAAASEHATLSVLLRPAAMQQQSCAAPLRLILAPAPQGGLHLRLLKRRGPLHAQWLHLPTQAAGLQGHLPWPMDERPWLPPRFGPHPIHQHAHQHAHHRTQHQSHHQSHIDALAPAGSPHEQSPTPPLARPVAPSQLSPAH